MVSVADVPDFSKQQKTGSAMRASYTVQESLICRGFQLSA